MIENLGGEKEKRNKHEKDIWIDLVEIVASVALVVGRSVGAAPFIYQDGPTPSIFFPYPLCV